MIILQWNSITKGSVLLALLQDYTTEKLSYRLMGTSRGFSCLKCMIVLKTSITACWALVEGPLALVHENITEELHYRLMGTRRNF